MGNLGNLNFPPLYVFVCSSKSAGNSNYPYHDKYLVFIFWKREIDIFHQILSQFIVSHFCKLKQLEIHLCTAFRYYVFYCCKKYDLFNEVNLTKLIFCFHISASWLSNLGSLSDLLHIHREILRGKNLSCQPITCVLRFFIRK